MADAFRSAELEDELRQRGWINSPLVVPSDQEQEVDKGQSAFTPIRSAQRNVR